MDDRRTERAAQAVIPVALVVFLVLGAVMTSVPLAPTLALLAAALVGVGLVWVDDVRSRVAGAVVVTLAVAALGASSASNLGWFTTCILLVAAGVATGVRAALGLLGLTYAALLVSALAISDDPGWAAWFAAEVFCFGVGLLVRRERRLTQELREAQAGLADRARLEERTRIAREMHDVIGHALTVSLLHVSSARLALAEDEPEEAAASLAEAERLAQQSLAEVRVAVGAMKGGDIRDPLPGALQVPDLIESFRRAGTPVTSEVAGDLATLSATEGLTVYRILQESLTNVARHAPGSAAHVHIAVAGEATRVVVDSDAAPEQGALPGNGVDGMRERAESVGGTLSAGPWREGWRVEATLP